MFSRTSSLKNKYLILFLVFISILAIGMSYFLNDNIRNLRSKADFSIGLVHDLGNYDPTARTCEFHGSTINLGAFACYDNYRYQCTSTGGMVPYDRDSSCSTTQCTTGQRDCSLDGTSSWICVDGQRQQTTCRFGCTNALCNQDPPTTTTTTCSFNGSTLHPNEFACADGYRYQCRTNGQMERYDTNCPQSCTPGLKGCAANGQVWECNQSGEAVTHACATNTVCSNGECVTKPSPTPFICHAANGNDVLIGQYICINNARYQCRTTGLDPIGQACQTTDPNTTGTPIPQQQTVLNPTSHPSTSGSGGWEVPVGSCDPAVDITRKCVYENPYSAWEYYCGYSRNWERYNYCPNGCSGGCH